MKINASNSIECIEVVLTEENTPVAYKNFIDSKMAEGLSEEESKDLAKHPIPLELYYESGHGLFAVEPDSLFVPGTVSPYSGEPFIHSEDGKPTIVDMKDRIVIPADAKEGDIIYALRSKAEDMARSALYRIINKSNGKHMLEPICEGHCFSLEFMEGEPIHRMEFTSISIDMEDYKGSLLFHGRDENGDECTIHEFELPDNGLFYLYSYIFEGYY